MVFIINLRHVYARSRSTKYDFSVRLYYYNCEMNDLERHCFLILKLNKYKLKRNNLNISILYCIFVFIIYIIKIMHKRI